MKKPVIAIELDWRGNITVIRSHRRLARKGKQWTRKTMLLTRGYEPDLAVYCADANGVFRQERRSVWERIA